MKILVVDDEKPIRQWFAFCIQRFDRPYQLAGEAANGREALEIFRRERPDVVITDIKMPLMDGIELMKAVKQEDPAAEVVILSCYADFKFAQEAIKLGAADYLLKAEAQDADILRLLDQIFRRRSEENRGPTVHRPEPEAGPLRREASPGGVRSQVAPETAEHHKVRYSAVIRKALEYIDGHYAETLSLRAVSQYIHLNPNYFCQLFKEETGENFSNYLTVLRLRKAEELLRESDLKAYEIAERVGYPNLSYFSRLFKKYFGKSPFDYRNDLR